MTDLATATAAALAARASLKRLSGSEWNSPLARGRRTKAMEATAAFAEAAGYTKADAASVVQHLAEPTRYALPRDVAERVQAADRARAEAAIVAAHKATPIVVKEAQDAGPLTLDELERILADFAAEVSMDLDRGLSGYGPGTVKVAEHLARRIGF